MFEKMLPAKPIDGHTGYYPVCNAKEWDELPVIYKAMEWFPFEVYNDRQYHCQKETTVAEYVVFDVCYATPYKISAKVVVHVQEVQKILFCLFNNPQFHLYTISNVIFANGVSYPAEWRQDSRTGAFAIYACGRLVGMQGGYSGFVPCQISETEDGFKWEGYKPNQNRCHVQLTGPFDYEL